MSDRISIPELRDLVDDAAVNDYVYSEDFDRICDALPALVEAVEAAHRAIEIQRAYQRGEQDSGVVEWGWPSFDRFDFGEQP